jgi:hypothetical protein
LRRVHVTRAPDLVLLALVVGVVGCSLSSQGSRSSSDESSSSTVGSGGHPTGAGGIAGGEAVASSSAVGSGGQGGVGASSCGGGGSSGGGGGSATCDAPDVLDPSTQHCYRLFDTKVEYEDVDAACGAWKPGGRFAAVSTEAEYDFLRDQFEAATDFWIGADDLDGDGTWTWVNGETWGEASGWGESPAAPWQTGEPAGGAGEKCLRMKSWLFESKNCDAQPHLCERN